MTGRLSRLLIAVAFGAVLAAGAVTAVLLWPASSTASATPDRESADAGFARDMAVHHQQAVELSFIVRDRTDDEEVRRLAYDVINTQANQRGMLLGWLDAWDLPKSSQQPPMTWMGHGSMHEAHDGSLMPGMATNAQMDKLRKADSKQAEILYLQLLTAHHKGGITMSEAAAGMAKTEQVRRLARGMVEGQESEMRLMADMLKERGATA
ncbi:DUF305 domain-containing protein [Streptomyces sp. CdTB01]|uniref:DUF305 domain-containing protein n=1 Tax=Streptomyces sp. CdTB01 TaxID=1725411 RepID=UPI00073A9D03|nr:DUF305 domain-containing protein [Streptomyces sp. CdTB01]ALV33211.1 DUF305 domain-containing protein [Streptomyces sp. CdTB01]